MKIWVEEKLKAKDLEIQEGVEQVGEVRGG